jgi:predicted nucleic acid-binding protein
MSEPVFVDVSAWVAITNRTDRFHEEALRIYHRLLPALADELVRLKVDVLVTPSTPAAQAAKNATKTIPIVFLGCL